MGVSHGMPFPARRGLRNALPMARYSNLTSERVSANIYTSMHNVTNIAHLGFQPAPFVIPGGAR